MAIVTSSSSRKSIALVRYVLSDKVNQRRERYVFASGVGGCIPEYAEQQFRAVRARAGKSKGFVQAYHVIQSFGQSELDPDNTDDWSRAHDLGRALAKDRFPGRQVLVVTQRDGEAGCLHNHLVVNSVETLTGKSLNSSLVKHKVLAEFHDDLLARHNFTQTVELKKARERRNWAEIIQQREGKYVWTIDLKERIRRALEDNTYTSFDDFITVCEALDVDVQQRGQSGRGVTYALGERDKETGELVIKPGYKRRSSRLGTDFMMGAIEAGIERNKKLQAEAQRQAQALEEAQRREREAAAQAALNEPEEEPVITSQKDRFAALKRQLDDGYQRRMEAAKAGTRRRQAKPVKPGLVDEASSVDPKPEEPLRRSQPVATPVTKSSFRSAPSSSEQEAEARLRSFEKKLKPDFFADLRDQSTIEDEEDFQFGL